MTQERSQAEVFTLDDVGRPGERVTWLASLRGALLVSFQQVLQCKGPFLQHMPAVAVRKEVYLSPLFMREHTEITRMILAATSWSHSHWKHLVTEAEFQERCRTGAKKFVVALACTSEVHCRQRRWPAGIKVLDKKMFLDAVQRYDLNKSGGGQ